MLLVLTLFINSSLAIDSPTGDLSRKRFSATDLFNVKILPLFNSISRIIGFVVSVMEAQGISLASNAYKLGEIRCEDVFQPSFSYFLLL